MTVSRYKNILDNQNKSYREDPTNNELTEQAVTDQISHTKLDEIKNAISGTSNTTTIIYNISVPIANTEVSHALPPNTKGFIIKVRGNSKLQISYTAGQSATVFITIDPGVSYNDDNFYQAQTLYFQTNKPTETVELITYT